MAINRQDTGGGITAKREKKEKDRRDLLPDQINLKGLARDEVPGQNGLVKQLAGRLLQRVPETETGGHPGYGKHGNTGDNPGDSWNGHSGKTVLTENQELAVAVPGDRNGTFEPQTVPEYQKRAPLFNGQVISVCAFGMTARNIREHIRKIYNVDISPELISRITGAVMEDVKERQNRALESPYAILHPGALRVKTGQDGKSRVKSAYAAPGVAFEGRKEA
jgi:transposase-like protein